MTIPVKPPTSTDSPCTPEQFYAKAECVRYSVMGASPAVRIFGSGPVLVFIHGFPTHGYTWRHLLPHLAQRFTCCVIDLPGMGDSDWTAETDFSFTAQAARLARLFEHLGIKQYGLIAHDTGATIARLVAAQNPDKVTHLVAFNTEIPQHRPPWVRTYQTLAKLPGANAVFRLTMRIQLWQRSPMGLRELYADKTLLKQASNVQPYVRPVVSSARRMQGMLAYLKGIEWSVVDEMQTLHAKISAKTLFIWGKDDKTFPLNVAQAMPAQFVGNARLEAIHGALLPHEESAKVVLDLLDAFLPVPEHTKPV